MKGYVLNNDCIASDHITAVYNLRNLTFKRLPPGSGLEELKANQMTSVWFGMAYFTLYGSLVDKSHIEKHLKNPDVQDELTSNLIRARTQQSAPIPEPAQPAQNDRPLGPPTDPETARSNEWKKLLIQNTPSQLIPTKTPLIWPMNQVIQEGAEEVDALSDDDEDVKEEEDDEVEAAGANYTSSYFDDADAERADTDEVVDLEPDVTGTKAKPKIRPQQRIIQAKTGAKTSDGIRIQYCPASSAQHSTCSFVPKKGEPCQEVNLRTKEDTSEARMAGKQQKHIDDFHPTPGNFNISNVPSFLNAMLMQFSVAQSGGNAVVLIAARRTSTNFVKAIRHFYALSYLIHAIPTHFYFSRYE